MFRNVFVRTIYIRKNVLTCLYVSAIACAHWIPTITMILEPSNVGRVQLHTKMASGLWYVPWPPLCIHTATDTHHWGLTCSCISTPTDTCQFLSDLCGSGTMRRTCMVSPHAHSILPFHLFVHHTLVSIACLSYLIRELHWQSPSHRTESAIVQLLYNLSSKQHHCRQMINLSNVFVCVGCLGKLLYLMINFWCIC